MTTEQRIKRLERENRWMKVGGGGLLLTLLVVLFGGAGQEKHKVWEEVRTHRLLLVNEASQIVGSFVARQDGGQVLLTGIGHGAPKVFLAATGYKEGLSSAMINMCSATDPDAEAEYSKRMASGHGDYKNATPDGKRDLADKMVAWKSVHCSSVGPRISIMASSGGPSAPEGLRDRANRATLAFTSGLVQGIRIGRVDQANVVEVRDGLERVRLEARYKEGEGPRFATRDEARKIRAVVGCPTSDEKRVDTQHENSESTVTLLGPNGTVLEQLPR